VIYGNKIVARGWLSPSAGLRLIVVQLINVGEKLRILFHHALSLSHTPSFARWQVNTGWGDFFQQANRYQCKNLLDRV